MALVGMLILIGRRLIDRSVKVGNFVVKLPMRSLSYLDDYFADALLLLIILLGLIQTLWLESVEPGFFEYSVAPWIWNLASFNVDKAISYIMAAPPITLAHVILAMIFIAYFPWGKMMHLFSFIYISPTVLGHQLRLGLSQYQGDEHGP